MGHRDPLEVWLFTDELGPRLRLAAEYLAEVRKALEELEAYLNHPPAKKRRIL